MSKRRKRAAKEATPPPAPRRYRVEIKKAAVKEYEGLPATVKKDVKDKLRELETDPRPPDCEKLKGVPKGRPDLYRVRVGDWRIVYAVFDKMLLVLVVGVRDRKEVYAALRTFIGRAN